MSVKIYSATPWVLDAKIVEVEVDISPGMPATIFVGLADTQIRESKERVRGCLRNSPRFKFPIARIIINLAPADLSKYGTQLDLPIAAGILLASGQMELNLNQCVMIGELSLDGSVRKVRSCLPMVLEARNGGFRQVLVPLENLAEAALVSGINVIPIGHVQELQDIFSGKFLPLPCVPAPNIKLKNFPVDFSEIRGQHFAKRGLEIAAAGGHNILLTGSPGVGKTILAQAMASILPEPPQESILEIMKINSALGSLKYSELQIPFRAPHSSIPLHAFVGGGKMPKPGELSLAHCGVLFMDEFPEFSRPIIESLRQPLEDGTIQISRLHSTHAFPARFIFIAAQNPCPCGYYQDPSKECVCTVAQINRYRKKVSGPILDRIDMQINVRRMKINYAAAEEKSSTVAMRVEKARSVQARRSGKLNGYLKSKEAKKLCILSLEAEDILVSAAERLELSNRTYFRMLKLAQTIADLDDSQAIQAKHMAEAFQYRMEQQ